MVRLCVSSTTLKITQVKNGSYLFEGSHNSIQLAKEFIKVVQPSQVVSGYFTSECSERLRQNLSDVSTTNSAIAGQPYYYVPVIENEQGPCIVTGYEVNEYVRSQTSKPESKYGLLTNFRAFDGPTYLAIICLCCTILAVKWLVRYFFSAEMKNRCKKRFRGQKRLNIQLKRHLRALVCQSYLLFFLVSTPFLNLFSTSQVVTDKPYLLNDYESIIRSNTSIIAAMTTNVDEYLAPSAASVKNNDLTSRFYNYFKERQVNIIKYRKDYFREADFFDFIFYYYRMAKSVVDKKTVFLTHFGTGEMLRRRFCALSLENEFFRLITPVDGSQKRILAGRAFRVGFYDSKLMKKLRILSEFQSIQGGHGTETYEINEWLKSNWFTSHEHRRQQRGYCIEDKIEAYRKVNTFDSDFASFKAFWAILNALFLIAFYVLLCENIAASPTINLKFL